MIRRFIAAVIALALAVPASAQEAGLVATYEGDGTRMVFEASGQSARAQIQVSQPGTPAIDIIMDAAGELYLTLPQQAGPASTITVRLSDAAALAAEALAPMQQQLLGNQRSSIAALGPMRLEMRGQETIAGFTGTVYHLTMKRAPQGTPPFPGLVVTSDPALAPLIRFNVRALELFEGVFPISSMMPPNLASSLDLLRSTAMLRFGEFRLVSLERRAVDPGRFALASEPVSREQIRSFLAAVTRPARPAVDGPQPQTLPTVSFEALPSTTPPGNGQPAFDVEEPPPPAEPD